MMTKDERTCRELFDIIMNFSREIRCCSRDEAICLGLTFQQFIILDSAARIRGLGLADLHRILSVEKSTTTRLVNPLIRRGLLQRDRALRDSRAAMLSLTKVGIETHRRAWGCLAGFFQGIAQNIPAAKCADVLEAMKLFTEAMQKAAAACRCCG